MTRRTVDPPGIRRSGGHAYSFEHMMRRCAWSASPPRLLDSPSAAPPAAHPGVSAAAHVVAGTPAPQGDLTP